jgi:hypothetical protein
MRGDVPDSREQDPVGDVDLRDRDLHREGRAVDQAPARPVPQYRLAGPAESLERPRYGTQVLGDEIGQP